MTRNLPYHIPEAAREGIVAPFVDNADPVKKGLMAAAAARKAVADGESVIEQARKDFRIVEGVGPGPKELAWRRQQQPKPRPLPKRPLNYVLTEEDRESIAGVIAMLKLGKFCDVAFYLARLHRDRDETEWWSVVRECGLTLTRAAELLAIPDQSPPLPTPKKRGRPSLGKPWEALGLNRRTWERQRARVAKIEGAENAGLESSAKQQKSP